MACGGCSKRRAELENSRREYAEKDLMGGYSNLTDNQIKARLEAYKRRYCKDCMKRYECGYKTYVECKKGS